jgi:hypothetical protein
MIARRDQKANGHEPGRLGRRVNRPVPPRLRLPPLTVALS